MCDTFNIQILNSISLTLEMFVKTMHSSEGGELKQFFEKYFF